ncbi:hypothetical protein B7463_g8704, partial [Scytalidium lignicola]
MASYVPRGDRFCFDAISWYHSHGQLSTDEYLNCLLDHLLGAQHPEDAHNYDVYNSLSTAIQSCMFEPNFTLLDDATHVKSLLLNCLDGTLDDAKQQAPLVLASLKANGIYDNILAAMICIACDRRDISLLDYCFTLTDDPVTLMAATERAIWLAGVKNPDPKIWSRLLDLGWLSTPQKRPDHGISELANQVILADQPHIELLEVLFSHNLVVSDRFFCRAAINLDPNTMRYLVSKFDASKMNTSNALLVASGTNARIVDILLDSGMDVNWMDCNTHWRDPKDGHATLFGTALHSAAEHGNKDSAKLLLQRGANKDTKDSWGKTPAQRAADAGHADVAELIQTFAS